LIQRQLQLFESRVSIHTFDALEPSEDSLKYNCEIGQDRKVVGCIHISNVKYTFEGTLNH